MKNIHDYEYYKDDWATIYCGDCLEIIPLMEPKSVDLVVTDPPYNIGYHYENYSDDIPELEYLKLLQIIPLPAVLIHYPEQSINLLPKVFGHCSKVVCWAYHNPLPVPKDFRLISWWGIIPDLSQIKQPYSTATITDKRSAYKINPNGRGLRDWWLEETIRFPSHENTSHPCQIPLEIMKRILKITIGPTILDPFLGSGTTCVAAKNLNRKSVGIEINPKYCEIAAERVYHIFKEVNPEAILKGKHMKKDGLLF